VVTSRDVKFVLSAIQISIRTLNGRDLPCCKAIEHISAEDGPI